MKISEVYKIKAIYEDGSIELNEDKLDKNRVSEFHLINQNTMKSIVVVIDRWKELIFYKRIKKTSRRGNSY